MSEDLKYICNFLGIDINNKYVLLDLGEIKESQKFIFFMRDNINHASLQYLNALQKLNQLKKLYTKEINKDREADAQTCSQLLEAKFNDIKTQLKQEHAKGLYPKLEQLRANDTTYFSLFELAQLNAIGEPKYLISLSDSHQLQEKLENVFVSLIYKSKNLSLENKKVANLIKPLTMTKI